MNERTERFVDRMFGPVLLSVVGLFCFWALASVIVASSNDRVVLIYNNQEIERIDPDTDAVSVPSIDGVSGPAVCIGDTVPVRGTRTNLTTKTISTLGSIVWEQQPPGVRLTTSIDVPGVADPGSIPLRFENPIPDEVIELTLANGAPTRWRIKGIVEVFAPRALPATFSTTRFTVVDCNTRDATASP